jgi:hypothetical protein
MGSGFRGRAVRSAFSRSCRPSSMSRVSTGIPLTSLCHRDATAVSNRLPNTNNSMRNDNTLPFSSSRDPNRADDNEFMLLEVSELLQARSGA